MKCRHRKKKMIIVECNRDVRCVLVERSLFFRCTICKKCGLALSFEPVKDSDVKRSKVSKTGLALCYKTKFPCMQTILVSCTGCGG